MAIVKGDNQSIMTHGWWITGPTGGVLPNAPTITAADDGDGDAITVTIAGDAGVTNQVYYKLASATAWSDGGSRSGDGTVQITGLTDQAVYDVIVQAADGDYLSIPSAVATVRVTGGSAITPAGLYSLPLHYLRLTLAGSATFQGWVGAANAAEALSYIFVNWATGATTPPYATVDWWDNFGQEKIATGAFFEGTGDLQLLIRGPRDTNATLSDAAYTFSNKLGAILAEMAALAGSPGYLDITGFQQVSGPASPTEDEIATHGDYYQAVYRVLWEGR